MDTVRDKPGRAGDKRWSSIRATWETVTLRFWSVMAPGDGVRPLRSTALEEVEVALQLGGTSARSLTGHLDRCGDRCQGLAALATALWLFECSGRGLLAGGELRMSGGDRPGRPPQKTMAFPAWRCGWPDAGNGSFPQAEIPVANTRRLNPGCLLCRLRSAGRYFGTPAVAWCSLERQPGPDFRKGWRAVAPRNAQPRLQSGVSALGLAQVPWISVRRAHDDRPALPQGVNGPIL
jgi:hypothetical protein